MKQQCDRVAGLDVHRDTVVACLRLGRGDDPELKRKKFSTTTAGVANLAAWMADFQVTRVVMESTGVYWKCVYYPLEGLFNELWLVNAGHVKNVPGRKTDIADAEWLADVAAHGMVRPSFVPPPPVRVLREITRYRKTQIVARAQEIQRLDKVLQDAGIKISSVASNVLGKGTRAMIEALIAGERDPAVLADMAKARMRAKIPALTEALVGRFAAHHGAVARAILDHIDFLDAAIAGLDGQVASRLGAFDSAVTLLETIPGVARRTAETIVAETGADMARFPTATQLCAWAGVAPANHESAGKRRPAGTRKGANWLRRSLIEAAKAASRTKDTYLAAQYRQIAARRGPNKATVAVAHSILFAAWHMLSNGETYNDLGRDYLTRRDTEAETCRLLSRLEALGHSVTISPAA
ncbi:IS110 family transposase [Acidiferrimicrobium sp. IK]|uniref:IS110 family transposase n=1 Tax=Acidiferrimicrobium sp. IK TaxID=2871700 RepID=UPI0021CB2B56|nr:IS110 family transposase [Acidiferrimicrobium sp. IK]MCU4187451.1 IS110 family transposase [Acidiferrimicrobium sp. IK]